MWKEKEFVFDVNEKDLVVEGVELTDEAKEEIIAKLRSKVDSVKKVVEVGKVKDIQDFPVDTMVPFVTLFYGT